MKNVSKEAAGNVKHHPFLLLLISLVELSSVAVFSYFAFDVLIRGSGRGVALVASLLVLLIVFCLFLIVPLFRHRRYMSRTRRQSGHAEADTE